MNDLHRLNSDRHVGCQDRGRGFGVSSNVCCDCSREGAAPSSPHAADHSASITRVGHNRRNRRAISIGMSGALPSESALQASFTEAPLTAIHLLEAARSEIGKPASLALPALLDGWQVTPYALLGERHEASNRLNHADDLYDRRRPENDPAWLYWMFRHSHNPESGRAFLTMGEAPTAERLLTEGLDQVPADFPRDRQLYLR